jgi:tRNA(Arg) A34 adenosine deaminase TadA
MCLGAIYWARPDKVYFANTRIDAASIQFDDLLIYDELTKNLHERTIVFEHIPMKEAFAAFEEWKNKTDRKMY